MLKKLKSLFVVEDASDKTPEQVKADETKIETAPEPASAEELIQVKTPQLSPDQKPDSKFVNVLLKAIDDANQQGFDYLEYKQSLQSLVKMDMDEATRYKSAYAMAQTMGASPASLVQSAEGYLKVLQGENQKFADVVKSQRNAQVNGREHELSKIAESIAAKKQKIEQLSREIEQQQESLGQIKADIHAAAEKVAYTEAQFALAYQSVFDQIKGDIERMKTYLM